MKLLLTKLQKCVACGETMQKTDQPVEHSFLVGDTEFVIRMWKKIDFCNECAWEEQRERERRIGDSAFDAGFDKGYEQAHQDARYFAQRLAKQRSRRVGNERSTKQRSG